MTSFEFLVALVVLIAGLAWIGRRLARRGTVTGRVPPIPEHPDPYALAWLSGGEAAVVRLATFELCRHGDIEISAGGNVNPLTGGSTTPLHPMARVLLGTIDGPLRPGRAFFSRLAGRESWTTAMAALRSHWHAQGLAHTMTEVRRSRRIALAAIAVVLAGTIARIVQTIWGGHHNVGFSVVLAVLSIPVLLALIPVGRVTALGRKFLTGIRRTRDLEAPRARALARQDQDGPAGDALLLSVAMLGPAVLVGTEWERVNTRFGTAEASYSGGGGCSSGSSCGSSSGGSGSGCGSSSGDGGGSSCGSGCGGGGGGD